MSIFRHLPLILVIGHCSALASTDSFITFESAPVHPIDLSPDGRTLAVCNVPDNRLEVFDVATGVPSPLSSIPVGHDPVTVRFHTTNLLWVVNQISSSINIVDLNSRQVVGLIQTRESPGDLVFAGQPTRAYLSCSKDNLVQVFDSDSHVLLDEIPIKGDRPRAMAVSPDGNRVYVAIFESGNASTMLAPGVTRLDDPPPPSVLSDSHGPYGGQDPPPNQGNAFHPPLSPYLDSSALSKERLIVKKTALGRWMDDNGGDWTEYVSGTNAARSGRVPGWDMPDRDLAVISTADLSVSYATGLMNLCMALATHPISGEVAVVGTDGLNEVRFEPNLKGTFLRVQLALVNPTLNTRHLHDLNPHLDYSTPSIPFAERKQSIGDPRAIVWNSSGTRAYVTGMGSDNLVVLDGNGERIQSMPIELDEGPTGMALDENRQRLYVLNRFSNSLTVIDTSGLEPIATVPLFDPTPEFVRIGRRHFYNTHRNSGLGHVSCASCHPDTRMDRLAWDLGVPDLEMMHNAASTRNFQFAEGFHPMKGPLVTLTLQGIIGTEPFHWRGDRDSLLDFHVTFTDLQGADRLPSVQEMIELERFLGVVRIPPNRRRDLFNELKSHIELPGFQGLATGQGQPPPSLPPGNAERGFLMFEGRDPDDLLASPSLAASPGMANDFNCSFCHSCQAFNTVERIPTLARSRNHVFVSPPLRSIPDKIGLDLASTESRAGFGFLHDGRAGTLTQLLAEGFGFDNNQDIADMIAFLLSIPGGGLGPDCGGDGFNTVTDAPAAVGHQVLVTSPVLPDPWPELLDHTLEPSRNWINGIEIIVHGQHLGVPRGWHYRQIDDDVAAFVSDREGEVFTLHELLALGSPQTPLLFMAVLENTGTRLALDRDEDGYFNQTESDQASDPLDVRSPSTEPPSAGPPANISRVRFNVYPGQAVNVPIDAFNLHTYHPNRQVTFRLNDPAEAPDGASISADGTHFLWQVPEDAPEQLWIIRLQREDNAAGPGSTRMELTVLSREVTIQPDFLFRTSPDRPFLEISWDVGSAFPRHRYEIQAAPIPGGPWRTLGFSHSAGRWLDRHHRLGGSNRFYRVLFTQ